MTRTQLLALFVAVVLVAFVAGVAGAGFAARGAAPSATPDTGLNYRPASTREPWWQPTPWQWDRPTAAPYRPDPSWQPTPWR